MYRVLRVVVMLSITLGGVVAAPAGDLNPPSGPVTPTMKTLVEVEPRVAVNELAGSAASLHLIDSPGSYYLTGNITGVDGRHGILITASDVTIDLNGYLLHGTSESLDGIHANTGTEQITVHSGTVKKWGGDGIDLWSAFFSSVRDVEVNQCGANGIVLGSNNNASGCIATTNGAAGFRTNWEPTLKTCKASFNEECGFVSPSGGAVVTNSTAASNRSSGFDLGPGSIVVDSLSQFNTLHGIAIGVRSKVDNCIARINGGHGIRGAGVDCEIGGCTVSASSLNGIDVPGDAFVHDCLVTSSGGMGVSVAADSRVANVTSRRNTGAGIMATDGVTISGCQTSDNGTHGITVGDEAVIKDNDCRDDSAGGISAESRCVIRSNTVRGGIAGITLTGSDNQMSDNALLHCTTGLTVAGTGNFIMRNAVSGGTTAYDVAANNLLAPIITSADLATNTNPNANIEN